MARFHGDIGFVESVETAPGVWVDVATERPYFGDSTRQYTKWQQGTSINDDVVLMDHISIVADDYAANRLGMMRYVKVRGIRWKINSIETPLYPRINLILGGVWNGITPRTSDSSGDNTGE